MRTQTVTKLHRQKIKLEKKLEEVTDKIKEAEEALLEQMQTAGTQSVKPSGGGNIRIDRKVWASAGGQVDRLVRACKKAGLDDLVKEGVNGNTLSGYVREFDPAKNLSAEQITRKLPRAIRDAVTVTEKIQLVVTGLDK